MAVARGVTLYRKRKHRQCSKSDNMPSKGNSSSRGRGNFRGRGRGNDNRNYQ